VALWVSAAGYIGVTVAPVLKDPSRPLFWKQ
jgi:hypothetical protein